MADRLAVLFPGIGYHCDKPLLYYSAKLARAAGFEVLPVPYAGFPEKVRGDESKLRVCGELAWTQANERLSAVKWDQWRDIVFIGKSIGTIVGSRYALEKGIDVRSVLLTPLHETFSYARGSAIAFHGTADPWANTGRIVDECRARGIPLFLTERANHSLETGDALRDIRIVGETMGRVQVFLGA